MVNIWADDAHYNQPKKIYVSGHTTFYPFQSSSVPVLAKRQFTRSLLVLSVRLPSKAEASEEFHDHHERKSLPPLSRMHEVVANEEANGGPQGPCALDYRRDCGQAPVAPPDIAVGGEVRWDWSAEEDKRAVDKYAKQKLEYCLGVYAVL